MSKHSLLAPSVPPPKRLHTLSHNSGYVHASFPITLSSLYDELILCIFSHLPYADVCKCASVSHDFARLAADNELWKRFYLQIYGRPRLRGTRGFIARTDGREIKSLPGRAYSEAEEYKDWKWMFRISTNWKSGRCALETLKSGTECLDHPEETLILLAGSLTITASCQESTSPNILLQNLSLSHFLACPSTLAGSCRITSLALDQSQPVSGRIQLVVCLSTGEITSYSLNHINPSISKANLTYVPARRNQRTSPIIKAVYHHPLLITLSASFTLSLFDLSLDTLSLRQTLTTFTSYPPVSLVLSTTPSKAYKLVLAYAIPVYPAHWSVGVTELVISGFKESQMTPSTSIILSANHRPLTVISTRTARTIDTPHGWIDERKLKSMRDRWSRKVARVADTQTDGKWVVLAPGDTPLPDATSLYPTTPFSSAPSLHSPLNLQLYKVNVSAQLPRLTFVRNLTGPTGPVSSIALADGRCISYGVNGSIWVWDLEGGPGAEVSKPDFTPSLNKFSTSRFGGRTVTFDERRIITSEAGKVMVRRFDV